MTKLTPTERLEDLREKRQGLAGQLEALVDRYQRFLENTNQSKAELVRSSKDKSFARQRMNEAKQFGDGVFDLLQTVASESSFYRFLVV